MSVPHGVAADRQRQQSLTKVLVPRRPSPTVIYPGRWCLHVASTCSNGVTGIEGIDVLGNVACCPLTCRNTAGEPECGGPLCKQREGGAKSCCVSTINNRGESCESQDSAPCYIGK